MYDLATVVTKFLHLGMSIDTAIAKVTSVPAQVISMPDKIGTLRVGAWGAAVLFEHRSGQYQLVDSQGQVRTGRQKLVPATVIRNGRVYRQLVGSVD